MSIFVAFISKTWAKINPYSFGLGLYIGSLVFSEVAT